MGWNITDSKELEDAIFKLKLRLAQKIGVRQGMTVVDMGCGQKLLENKEKYWVLTFLPNIWQSL